MAVGPESASSHPGPACYRKGGPLTVTDANLALGRLIPEHFPSVFGPNEDEPLDVEIVLVKFEELTKTINQDTGKSLTWYEVADGFLQVANTAMCGPIRSLTEGRGHDAAKHNLASFGGAGGQHACAIAEALGIGRVLIHKYSSILSAYGIGLADIVHEEEKPCAKAFDASNKDMIYADLQQLSLAAQSHHSMARFSSTEAHKYLFMRYDASETSTLIPVTDDTDPKQLFVYVHHQQFGFTPVNRKEFVDNIRVRAVGKNLFGSEHPVSFEDLLKVQPNITPPKPNSTKSVYFKSLGWADVPVYSLGSLAVGSTINGPALVVDNTQTIVLSPDCTATATKDLLILDVSSEQESLSATTIDPVQLSVFRHRFYGIAEQMGRVLQNVSVSANIKERLDFSCAIFSPDGSLVANAPHVPAMIGSMGFAVKCQIEKWKMKLKDGNALLSNSPVFGGVHVPDLTVITPVFDAEGKNIIFWTASRGHHADVGGILPGSMPPLSKHLWEEGALFESFLLVRDGQFADDELKRILCEEPAKYSGCSGTRCFQDNVTDIKAQVAANHCGIRLVRQLIKVYAMEVVQMYMSAIQDSAQLATRNLFKKISEQSKSNQVSAIEYMDDGTPIQLKVSINQGISSATFDFTGIGPEVYEFVLTQTRNWNAPIAICNAAVIFALRCMVDSDIPLNHGCMKPITLIIPDDSLLKPSPDAAVCAGNVLTSQRIVDVIFKAFRVCAASQGCMNNFTFGIDGKDSFGYYETIAGGSGAGPTWAGPTWAGTSGLHTNMTNTRITEPESLERRYPVLLRRFSFRPESGGKGLNAGGDGVIRDVEFRVPMSASILSERRSFAPYGMEGGEDGMRGRNTWVIGESGRVVPVGGKGSVNVQAGDRMVIETPGGGGHGLPLENNDKRGSADDLSRTKPSGFIGVAGGSVGGARDLAEQV